MRSLPALAALALLAAALSGCTASDAPTDLPEEPASPAFEAEVFEGEPDDGAPAGEAGTHGEPQRDDGTVEAGMSPTLQIPSFWARRTVTITNDFGGVDFGNVFLGADFGSITIVPSDGDSYSVEAVLEARGMTEQDARDALDRMEVSHSDVMEADGLHLITVVKQRPATQMIPLVTIGTGGFGLADLVVTLPSAPAYEMAADTSSGELSISGFRGPMISLSASSGDIDASELNAGTLSVDSSSGAIDLDTIQAGILEATTSMGGITGTELLVGTAVVDSSSGDIELDGIIDTLEADASSGSLTITSHGRSSGVYELSASSGDVRLSVLTGVGRAYHVKAEASSGTVEVDLEDSDTIEEEDDEVEVVTDGFDEAAIQTVVDVSTSSGDILVTDSSVEDDDDDEDAEHDHGG